MNGQPIAGALPVALPANPAGRLAGMFDVHYDRLYRLARRLTSSIDDALDLVQETFLRAARSARSVPIGHASEEAWLVRVLINIRRDQWRKSAARKRHDQEISRPAKVGSDQEAALIARTTVWRALDFLPPRRRAIVVMYELEGLTMPAIASLLGISQITVRCHLSMGRRELARALRPCMGETNENR
jgi:RNA polymerase sigma-70 factor, ECF subfamily